MKSHFDIGLEKYNDSVYETMLDEFSVEDRKKIEDFIDEYFPINNDDWTEISD